MHKKEIRTQKNSIEEKKPLDFILLITVLMLLALGIVMVLSASSPSALSDWGNSFYYVERQAGCAVIGLILMFIISRIDYRKYKMLYKLAYIGSIILSLMVVIPNVGVSVNGATRWIKIGIQFQPSEIAKIGLIIFYAAYLTNHKDELKELWRGFFKPFIYLIPIIGILLLLQNHLSASIIIILVTAVMMILAGTKIKYFLTFGTAGAIGGIGLLVILAQKIDEWAFRLSRITSFLNPWEDIRDDSWQIVQSLYAIGSGGLFGVGLGASKQKYSYIPEPHNDFIFAILAEELGFVGCLVVIVLFGIFIWRGILIAIKAPDMFGSLLAGGITALIGLQAIINIAVVTSSIPVTGMALPFFSYGGTSLIILLCSVGILFNISRQGNKL